MFLSRNKKNNVYPRKSQFYYIKVALWRQNRIGIFSWYSWDEVNNSKISFQPIVYRGPLTSHTVQPYTTFKILIKLTIMPGTFSPIFQYCLVQWQEPGVAWDLSDHEIFQTGSLKPEIPGGTHAACMRSFRSWEMSERLTKLFEIPRFTN